MEQLWLWSVTRLSFFQGRPPEFLGLWSIVGGGSLIDLAYTLVSGNYQTPAELAVPVVLAALGLPLAGIAAVDVCFPRTVEGRVRRSDYLRVKRFTAATVALSRRRLDQDGVYSRRITIEDDRGRARTFRAAADLYYDLSGGDLVRAKVGMRLRWIYDIRVTERARADAS